MAQVLSPMDSLRSSHDDYGLSPSSTDWRSKYNEAADMLAEARHELDDFVHSSKELEEELLRELERTEKTQKELKDKISRSEYDRDDWKNKFISLQTTHNTAVNSLHRELDTLRKEHQQLKVRFRDLEMGNDDLERTERAISSSLADTEAKYGKVLEEKILLEQELLSKAGVEEEAQRLRDEIRDANSEIQVLRDQVDHYKTARNSLMTPPATDSSCSPRHDNSSMVNLPSATSDDQLLDTTVPKDVLMADEVSPSIVPPLRSSRKISVSSSGSSQKASTGVLPKPGLSTRLTTPALHSRSNSLRTSPMKPTVNLSSPRTPRAGANSRTTQPPKSKGVQMVSEMRAKVRNLEQKLQTRVPRLRSGTFDRGTAPQNGKTPPNAPTRPTVQTNSPGWVLVMEETPPSRRVVPRGKVSPPPTAFPRKASPSEDSPSHNRGPIPRRSFTNSRSSIPTPSTSRPGSPDFNPPPIETRSMNALKRTSVPAFSFSGRTSFGSSTDSREGPLSTSQRSTTTVRGTMAPPPMPANKPLSASALGHPTKFSSSLSKASLGASRIGRPMSLSARRTDTGPAVKNLPVDEMGVTTTGKLRPYRSGSISQFGADGETF